MSEAQKADAGMAAAKGEYFSFVDGDDYIEPEMIAGLWQALAKQGDRLAICGFRKVTEEGELLRKTEMRFPDRMTEDEFWYQLFFPYRELGTVAWNKLYHRSLLEGLAFPVGRIHEDEWLVHRYIQRVGHIAVAKKCLYDYVARKGSITAQPLTPRSLSILDALSRRTAYFMETGKQRAVVLSMRNYARYVIFFQDDWRKEKQYAAEKNRIREDFRGEMRRYRAVAPAVDYAYWVCALHAPGLMRQVIRRSEARKKTRAAAQA